VRHTEFWARMEAALGPRAARVWADQQVLTDLGGKTVVEALDEGMSPKAVWAAVWSALELPPVDRCAGFLRICDVRSDFWEPASRR
jgi:hypothetical protein